MKAKYLLSILSLGLLLSAFSQNTIELTFTAENNGQYVQLDSILIENLTQEEDTILYAPDTVLVLDYVTNIRDNHLIKENTFTVSQNYPNPFNGKTEFKLNLTEMEYIKITVIDILGRKLADYSNTLARGNYSFTFFPGNEKYYLLTVTGKQTNQSIKMLNANNKTVYDGKYKIEYNGFEDEKIIFKSQRAMNDFGFNLGDELQFTAYALTETGNIGSAIETDAPENSTMYELNILGGLRCPGMPTITDIDGNIYNTVQIGNQCWMKENLKTTTYRNGTSIPNVTDSTVWSNMTTGAYVWYDNDISWKDKYGALYNWFTTVDSNGHCPIGWHVPTSVEWDILFGYIGGTYTPHGNELKSWRQVNSSLGGSCNTNNHPRWDQDVDDYGTDDYGFAGLPGGVRYTSGPFLFRGSHGYWWTSTLDTLNMAWLEYLYYASGFLFIGHTNNKQAGFSVRCLRD